jgi:hypothetical protein
MSLLRQKLPGLRELRDAAKESQERWARVVAVGRPTREGRAEKKTAMEALKKIRECWGEALKAPDETTAIRWLRKAAEVPDQAGAPAYARRAIELLTPKYVITHMGGYGGQQTAMLREEGQTRLLAEATRGGPEALADAVAAVAKKVPAGESYRIA